MKELTFFYFFYFLSFVYGDSLKFVAVGDWGGQETAPFTTPIQLQVAKQMGETASSFGSQFTLGMGDNFYSHGIPTNDRDPRFKNTFEDVYTAASLQSRWYIIAGNHDHLGNVSAEIAYTQRSTRWYFPSEWYTETLNLPKTNVTVQFIFFDTVVFTGRWPKEHKQPIGATDPIKSDKQYEWIKKTLENSKADWIFVVGHYPVWSIAEHGPTQNLVSYLKPLLEEHKVAGYFNGHDHNLQHLEQNGVDYYLSGAGHDIDLSTSHKKDVPKGVLKFHWPSDDNKHGGFITVEVKDEKNMNVVYYSDQGQVLYQTSKINPRK